jgi:hypothetical protein
VRSGGTFRAITAAPIVATMAPCHRRALGLGALGFTSEWPVLMGLIERTLGQSPEPH